MLENFTEIPKSEPKFSKSTSKGLRKVGDVGILKTFKKIEKTRQDKARLKTGGPGSHKEHP